LQPRFRRQKNLAQRAEAGPLLPSRTPKISRITISRLKNGLGHLPKSVPDHPAEAAVVAAVVDAVGADANKPSLKPLPPPR
jgi:hypothetical protein